MATKINKKFLEDIYNEHGINKGGKVLESSIEADQCVLQQGQWCMAASCLGLSSWILNWWAAWIPYSHILQHSSLCKKKTTIFFELIQFHSKSPLWSNKKIKTLNLSLLSKSHSFFFFFFPLWAFTYRFLKTNTYFTTHFTIHLISHFLFWHIV